MNDYPHPMDLMQLPCSGIAELDADTGLCYRCQQCMAIVGSMSMPQECKDEIQKYDNWKELGGEGWDYKIPQSYPDDWT